METNGISCAAKVNYAELLKDKTFEFLVGPDQVAFNIYVSALSAISEPLGFLMTNGNMEESIKQSAALPDCDPETFTMFAKFAYMGLCGASDGIRPAQASKLRLPPAFRCHYCGTSHANSERAQYPFCHQECRSRYEDYDKKYYNCVVYQCYNYFDPKAGGFNLLCPAHRTPAISESHPSLRSVAENEVDLQHKGGSAFFHLKYGFQEQSHQALSDHLDRHCTSDSPCSKTQPLLQHAKLYVMAQKYMVEDLQEICLHKLHRNLLEFKIDDESIGEVVDLVLYTYTNTSDEGNILEGTIDKLRYLVMAYVKDRAKELLRYVTFRSMLGASGTQTEDFLAITFGQQVG